MKQIIIEKECINLQVIEIRLGYDTGANAREGVGVAKDGPEVEAIDGPKEREKSEAESVEPASVAH